HVKVPRRCPREARRARERLAHLPPELPRAKANPERRDDPRSCAYPSCHVSLWDPEVHGIIEQHRTPEDREPWLQQFFGLHRGALVATMDSRTISMQAAGLWFPPGGKHGDRDGRLHANRDGFDSERCRTLRIDD